MLDRSRSADRTIINEHFDEELARLTDEVMRGGAVAVRTVSKPWSASS